MRLCFPFIAQLHQIFHSLPIAMEIALRRRNAEVHVACSTQEHLAFARRLAADHYPGARVSFDLLSLPAPVRASISGQGRGIPPKLLSLLCNLRYFRGFDALVVPERTTLRLRPFLSNRTRLIWTRHGAGDRESGFRQDIEKFDFVLMAGGKIERRLRESRRIRRGRYATGIYAKFDLIRRMPKRTLFANDRPTVLYTPHFRPGLSSWPVWGRQVLDFFAASRRYNLVFAPHIRLFYPPGPEKYEAFREYEALPHMRIDLGSEASADMSYTRGADLYLGDVSSQVAEFLTRPRPCVFLNAHGTDWLDNPDYHFWTLGPVVDYIENLEAALETAFADQPFFRPRQKDYVRDTFGDLSGDTAAAGAEAIIDYLSQARADTVAQMG